MKTNLLWAFLGWLSLLSVGAQAQTPLAQETFEDGTSGANPRYGYTTVVPFTPTATRFFERKLVTNNSYPGLLGTATGAAIYGTEGTYLWAARSVRSTSSSNINSNEAAVLQLNDIAATNYTNLRMVVAFADPSGTSRNSVVNAQRIRLQYSFDGGPWVTAGLILGNSEQTGTGGYYQQDTSVPLDSIPDGIILNQTFQDITARITGTGTTLRVRIVADTRLPQFVFDNVRVFGTLSTTAKPALANLETTAASYTEGGSPVPLTNALTVGYSDNSATNVTGSTVSVSANFVSGDQLNFVNQNGISGSYNTGTGILTLTGTATQATYQAALRSITYSNTNTTTLNSGTRQVTFQVSNGSTALSNTPVRTINVTAALNAPATLPYTENFDTDGEGLRYLGNTFVSTAATAGFFRATTSPATSGGSPIGNINFTGWSGGYWYGENTKLNGTPTRTIQLAPVNAAGTTGLKFVIAVGSSSTQGTGPSWNPGGYFKLYYRANGGSWTEFGSFTPDGNGVLHRGGNADSAAIGPVLRYVTFPLPAAAAVSNLDFQLTQLSDGDEELAFDNIRISAATAPTVATNTPPAGITTTSAVLGGNVTSNGDGTLTERGVVYVAGTGTPTVSNTKALVSTSGVLTGAFSGTVAGLSPGTTYTVRAYAINEAGPGYGASVTFMTLAPVGGTTVVTNVACNGGSNGAINLTPSGGVGPYTFLWSPGGQTTEDRTGLAAGTYSVTITDATGATGTISNITVTQPASAVVGTTVVTNVACNGGSNGAINLTPSGGTAPYTFNWGGGLTTEDRTGLVAGTYTVIITDANGCTRTVNATLTQPAPIAASTLQTDVTTNGGSDGSATITVSGGTPSYTYSWSPNVSNTATAANLSAGLYTVTVTDANGCTIVRTFTIAQPAAPLTATMSTPSASPTSTAPIPFAVTFSQSVGTTFTASDVTVAGGSLTSGTFSGSGPGPYTFTVTPSGTGTVTVSLAASVATDANNTGNSASNAVSVQFQTPTITLAPASLPDGTQGTAYSVALTASGGTSPYAYAITAGALPSGLSLNLSNGTISGTPAASGSFTFTVTARDNSATPGPYSGSRNYTLTIAALSITWTGSFNTDWFNASNWTSNQVPSATIDVTIPTSPSGGRFPIIISGIASTSNLTVNSGATLTQFSGTLIVYANLTNNGTFLPTGGTVVLGITALSNLYGSSNTRFWNLTVGTNGAQQRTSASTSVQRTLALNGGNFATNGNPFTLESNATNTAMVVNNGGVVNGTVTVQRYIDPSNPGPGYRHYSSPVQTTTIADLTTSSFTPVVNGNYTSATAPRRVQPYPTVYYYDQSRLATANASYAVGDFDNGFLSPSALSSPLAPGSGYAVNVSSANLVDFVGQLNNGTISKDQLARGAQSNAGWQLLGNPYPSPIDWNQLYATSTGIETAFYVFKSSGQYTGAYASYANGQGINGGTGTIPSMQGFFVRVAAGQTGSVTFTNQCRRISYDNPAFARQAADTRPTVRLELMTAQGQRDEALVYFEPGATSGVDTRYDAVKLANSTRLNLCSRVGSDFLAINGLPNLSKLPLTVPLSVQVPSTGRYTLLASQLANVAGNRVVLHDRQTGTRTDLTDSAGYVVELTEGQHGDRFDLLFNPATEPTLDKKGQLVPAKRY